MSIPISDYVDINSVVAGAAAFPERELVGRFMTGNNLLPPSTFLSFANASAVENYFGPQSEEYLRSVAYFNFISKSGQVPDAIQFARWVQNAANPQIISIQSNNSQLSSWTGISNGSFVLTMGGFTFTLSSLNFTSAGSLAAVASALQTAIQAESGGGAMWTSATVTYQASYDGVYNGVFILTGGAAGTAGVPISVMAGGGGTDITGLGLLGWLPAAQYSSAGTITSGAIWSSGSASETVTTTLENTSNLSSNFGSFAFLTNLAVTQQNIVDAANWANSGTDQNYMYMYSQAVNAANYSAVQAAVANIGGIALTYSPNITTQLSGTLSSGANTVTGLTSNVGLSVGMPVTGTDIPANTVITSLVGTTGLTLSNNASGTITTTLTFYTLQFPEQIPMVVMAATDYSVINAVQNYMFQQIPGLTPSVTTQTQKAAFDAISLNYYGQTQSAGVQQSFYQNGKMQGLITNALDQNVYANEVWLKGAATAAIMNLLLAVAQVPANMQGVSMIISILQSVINQALLNGTISVGKTLNPTQQAAITQITGDPAAWYQVQNSGYWLNVFISASGSPVIYTAEYLLVYSKDDVIRQVVGTHDLI